ncbi:MAG: hypothetical protein JW959_01520 [Pirellulales bacterium]|nr:hypothetical protein [Pirellulales bacterium]
MLRLSISDFRFTISLLTPAVLCLMLAAGCEHGPEVVPVEGRITYGGGPWPKPGVVYFLPVESAAGSSLRPAWAKFDTNGRFFATSFREGDGLVPGKYLASVECWEKPPSMSDPTPPVNLVPERFRSAQTSGLEFTVDPGRKSVSLDWDVPKE